MLPEPPSLTKDMGFGKERGTLRRAAAEHQLPCKAEPWETWERTKMGVTAWWRRAQNQEPGCLGTNPDCHVLCAFRKATLGLPWWSSG